MNGLTPNEKPVDKFDECDCFLVDWNLKYFFSVWLFIQ